MGSEWSRYNKNYICTFTISAPGEYKLAANLTLSGTNQTAITVSASNVVVDLNGLTLGTSDQTFSNTGIAVSNGANNVTVQNGSINGDFAFCVDLEDSEGFAGVAKQIQ